MITEFAPAKINLALHVTGQRRDGYHLLDSLVVFADIGDRLTLVPCAAPGISLTVKGPQARALSGPAGENLVLKAAALFRPGKGAELTLHKELPVAAGLGGGSSDAAAALRALARAWRQPLPAPEALRALGADVPVCLLAESARMRGIGERLEPLALPPFGLVLINPRIALETGAVFAALAEKQNPALPEPPSRFASAETLASYLRHTRNDLEAPAIREVPEIGTALAALAAAPGCLLARMSGSGASSFGLFPDLTTAQTAGRALQKAAPHWWVAAGRALV